MSGYLARKLDRLKIWINGVLNKKPVYNITQNGIKREFYNLKDTKNLPFDPDTYEDTQLFIGHNYANPWYVDIESIEKQYDIYEYNHTLDSLIEQKHVIPSQRYKRLMIDDTISNTFSPNRQNLQRLQQIVIAIAVGVGFLVMLQLT